MPSVYVGGAMHDEKLADATIAHSLEIAHFCKKVGCAAIVDQLKAGAGGKDRRGTRATGCDARQAGQNARRRGLSVLGTQSRCGNGEQREVVEHARIIRIRYVLPICLDLDWVHQGDQDPLFGFLRAAEKRVACLHLRNSNKKLWLESLGDGDIDYRKVAAYLKSARLKPLLMVELAYRPETVTTRPLEEDLRLSRIYAEQIFKLKA